MADVGNGYIRASAGQAIRVTYRVRRSTSAAYHVVFDSSSTAPVRTFTAGDVGDASDSFRLGRGVFEFDWSVLALAKAASVVVQIEVDDVVRYRREKDYSGSGVTPWGTVTFKMT